MTALFFVLDKVIESETAVTAAEHPEQREDNLLKEYVQKEGVSL